MTATADSAPTGVEKVAGTQGEGSRAPAACDVCSNYAERLAGAFVSRHMDTYNDLKTELREHQKATHDHWWRLK